MCDILRGALQYDRMSTMLLAFQLICALDSSLIEVDPVLKEFVPSLEEYPQTHSICVLDVKNRFAVPTSAGWSDICLRCHFQSDADQHVWEIQLCHLDSEFLMPNGVLCLF